MAFLTTYETLVAERAELGVPPLALSAEQTAELIAELEAGADEQTTARLIELLKERVGVGVDDAAKVKCDYLARVIDGRANCRAISPADAINMLSTMLGGYNVAVLLDVMAGKIGAGGEAETGDKTLAQAACNALKNIIFVHDAFTEVERRYKAGCPLAAELLKSWANAEWFTSRAPLPERIEAVCFKVPGETNTDDLSPASEAFTRSDIPLHAQAMLLRRQEGALADIERLKATGRAVAYVGDVVGTGSSRKSAINSVQWHLGSDIPGVPNKRSGGIVIGSTIAPIFFNTAQDSGALPITADVSALEMGDEFTIDLRAGEIIKNGATIAKFALAPNTILDEVRAGGRIPLIIGRSLCAKAREALGMGAEEIFAKPAQPANTAKGYTLAQKMLARACGLPEGSGVVPGMYIEPRTATVGSQDTTGPMTRDEIKELAALGFNADFVLQSFCHTAAYPKPSDVITHATLPRFMSTRGGVALRPGDGVIHSWLNRFCLPDTVGTGGDSHTRFPIGISFPAGSGLVAFAAVTGAMPLNVPRSILVRFKGELQPGITLRDLVNAIPLAAIREGLLTVEKKGKKNIFAGKILEIEGLENLKVEQAFELSDASAERSAAACCVNLSEESVAEYLRSNIALIEAMIAAGYEDAATLARRAGKMREWLAAPKLLRADANAEYEHIFEIDVSAITEPILACPNDPDDVATLSDILADSKRAHKIDEVFIGSCMTNIGHYRAAGEILRGRGQLATRLWIAPPTKMDKAQLTAEGYYSVYGAAGARIEVPGCSLCMGNQARVADGAVVFSTSTRNFDNRMGMGAQVYLGSAELAAVCALLGRLPSAAEYLEYVREKLTDEHKAAIYKYLNFDQIANFALAGE